jgi:hypothetical protein
MDESGERISGSSNVRDTRWAWLVAGGLLLLVCVALVVWLRGESGPTVTGTVQLNGQLLARGSIALAPVNGTSGPGGGGSISEGKFDIKRGLQPGKYRVEIRGTVTLSRQVRNATIPSELVNEEVSVIPEQFNSKSNLIREVGPGANVLNFDLKGDAPK